MQSDHMEKIVITEAKKQDFSDIIRILSDSSLGKRYYPTSKMLTSAVLEASERDKFTIAKISDNVVGFAWYTLNGAFALYPYLHTIVVDEKYRSSGVGKELMSAYEDQCLEIKNELRGKSFLVVSDDNLRAKSFYKRLGYEELFPVNNLFRKGVTEILMKKDIMRRKKG